MRQYIGFKLNENEFTIPILKVREIVNTPTVTKLPQSPHYVRGIINLRGSIIPVLDLKELVSMGTTQGTATKTIVITNGNMVFGVLVDEITSVINIDEADIEPPESFMQDNLERVEGVARFDDRLLILLDTDKLVDLHDVGMFEEGMLAGVPGPHALEGGDGETLVAVAAEKVPAGIPEDLAGHVHGPDAGMAEAVPPPVVEEKSGSFHASETELDEVKNALSRKYGEDEMKGEFVGKIVELIDALASHDYERADTMIAEMQASSKGSLYKEIGTVTRKLHDSLKEFRDALDPRIKQIADEEVPNAVDSLEYVITKTEDAANKTMEIVEKYQKDLSEFTGQLGKIKNPKRAVEYLNEFKGSLSTDLTEIMLAQEFQDITGQTIRKVIELVNAIEAELVGLIATFGVKSASKNVQVKLSQKISQNDVDDLLKEFGF